MAQAMAQEMARDMDQEIEFEELCDLFDMDLDPAHEDINKETFIHTLCRRNFSAETLEKIIKR